MVRRSALQGPCVGGISHDNARQTEISKIPAKQRPPAVMGPCSIDRQSYWHYCALRTTVRAPTGRNCDFRPGDGNNSHQRSTKWRLLPDTADPRPARRPVGYGCRGWGGDRLSRDPVSVGSVMTTRVKRRFRKVPQNNFAYGMEYRNNNSFDSKYRKGVPGVDSGGYWWSDNPRKSNRLCDPV